MKKIFSVAFALTILSLTALNAQDKKFFVALQGGPNFSINENGQTYFDNSKALDLMRFNGAASLGYYFNPRYGLRLYGEYSQNKSAANVQETSAGGFWPYSFNSGICYVDWIINGGDVSAPKAFNWRPYFGVGAAYSFGLKWIDGRHPWQAGRIEDTIPAISYAFRYGIILEYVFSDHHFP